MYTCQITQENNQFKFECLDEQSSVLFKSTAFVSRDEALITLNSYLNSGLSESVYEVCEGDDCHYFKFTYNGLLLLESRSFDDKETVYDLVEKLKGGCAISHIVDKSFANGDVYYYLTCTSDLQFRQPVKVSLEREDNQFVASIPELNLYAYSDDLREVIGELKLDLDDLYNDLFVQDYRLSSKAIKIKQEFESKLMLDGVS